MKKVEKILLLQKQLHSDETLTEREKRKIHNKIKKLEKKFLIVRTHTISEKPFQFFVTRNGQHIYVDENEVIHIRKVEINYEQKPILPYLFAFLILLFIYLTVIVLSVFDIVTQNIITPFSFGIHLAGIILNLWSFYDSREIVFKFKWLFALNGMVVLMNAFGIAFNGYQIFG
jgi:hypothetical protein